MNLRRFFAEPCNITDNKAVIIEDAMHISKVLRMNTGDEIIVFDGSGYEYLAKLISIDKSECVAEILSKSISSQEPETKVTIYQGIPKSDKMETIIQKSVELGVTSIVPVAMDRCVSKLDDGKKCVEKINRWNKIAIEAAKQCGRGILPKVEMPIKFEDAISEMTNTGLAIMPYELLANDNSSSLREVLRASSSQINIIIGPEGGFSDAEAHLAKNEGVNLVGLGPRILRTETVSSTILSIIMYDRNEI